MKAESLSYHRNKAMELHSNSCDENHLLLGFRTLILIIGIIRCEHQDENRSNFILSFFKWDKHIDIDRRAGDWESVQKKQNKKVGS